MTGSATHGAPDFSLCRQTGDGPIFSLIAAITLKSFSSTSLVAYFKSSGSISPVHCGGALCDDQPKTNMRGLAECVCPLRLFRRPLRRDGRQVGETLSQTHPQ